MPHSIILVFEEAKDEDTPILNNNATPSPLSLLSDKANKNIKIQMLGKNILQLEIETSLTTLSEIMRLMEGHKYKVAIFDEKINWYECPEEVLNFA